MGLYKATDVVTFQRVEQRWLHKCVSWCVYLWLGTLLDLVNCMAFANRSQFSVHSDAEISEENVKNSKIVVLGNRRLINTCNCDLSLKPFSCSRLRKAFMAERRPFDLILKKFRLSCFKMRCATELPLSPAPVTGRGVKS